jgi:sialate O-acetylesterase
LVCLGIIVAATPAQGAVRLPAIFGDHMVLQQQTEAAIWGWATPDTTVTIRPSWEGAQAVEVKAGADGSWRTRVATPAAGGPYTIELTEGETLTLEDVLIGEVWLCSGQSNMQWAVSQAAGAQEAIANGDLPKIRLFYVKRETAREPQNDCKGSWQVCSSETVADFSAVGYFFGRKLHQELGGPVGLICSAWGGTPAEAWTSGETLSGLPGYEKIVQLIRDPKLIREELAWQEYRQELFAWEKNLLGTDPGTQQRWHQGEVDTSDWQSMAAVAGDGIGGGGRDRMVPACDEPAAVMGAAGFDLGVGTDR